MNRLLMILVGKPAPGGLPGAFRMNSTLTNGFALTARPFIQE